MIPTTWQVRVFVAWFVVAGALVVLAVCRVIPWTVVSLVTMVNGGVVAVRWWHDRRARLIAEMTAADDLRRESAPDGQRGARG